MRDDAVHFVDMLVSARKIRRFCQGLTWETFSETELHQSAVIRELQVIGEATRLLSQETKDLYPQIHWTEIAGMRNMLIHEYFRISLRTVWLVIQNDIPELIAELEKIVPPDDSDQTNDHPG